MRFRWGWEASGGKSSGRNAAFVPGWSVPRRIFEAKSGDRFGVEDLEAAFLLDRASESFRLGRGAEKQARRQTRV